MPRKVFFWYQKSYEAGNHLFGRCKWTEKGTNSLRNQRFEVGVGDLRYGQRWGYGVLVAAGSGPHPLLGGDLEVVGPSFRIGMVPGPIEVPGGVIEDNRGPVRQPPRKRKKNRAPPDPAERARNALDLESYRWSS